MNRIYLILLFIIIGFSSFKKNGDYSEEHLCFEVSKDTLTGKVIAITDGDTFKLLTNDSIVHRIRIANIDCPERKQPFSKRAKQFTSDAIFGKTIEVEILSKDRYGRLIANVLYDNGLILNEELLKHGYAWHFLKYSKDKDLQKMEDDARNNRIGLWQDSMSIPPWEWRANKKKKVPK
jgi:endonuclease YncB( thermonuclease family)